MRSKAMVVGKSEALGRQRNYKSDAFKRNTAYVFPDGEVFARDDHIREIVEHRLYFSVRLDRWLGRAEPGITVVNKP